MSNELSKLEKVQKARKEGRRVKLAYFDGFGNLTLNRVGRAVRFEIVDLISGVPAVYILVEDYSPDAKEKGFKTWLLDRMANVELHGATSNDNGYKWMYPNRNDAKDCVGGRGGRKPVLIEVMGQRVEGVTDEVIAVMESQGYGLVPLDLRRPEHTGNGR